MSSVADPGAAPPPRIAIHLAIQCDHPLPRAKLREAAGLVANLSWKVKDWREVTRLHERSERPFPTSEFFLTSPAHHAWDFSAELPQLELILTRGEVVLTSLIRDHGGDIEACFFADHGTPILRLGPTTLGLLSRIGVDLHADFL